MTLASVQDAAIVQDVPVLGWHYLPSRIGRSAVLDDMDPEDVTEVLLSATGFLALLLVAAVAAVVVFALGALRHW